MPKRKKVAMWKSSKKKNVSGISESAAQAMFEELRDPDDETRINMDGIVKLGEKLGVDAVEDVRILVLLWKLGCSGDLPGCVTRDEWMQGCTSLQCDSWTDLQKLIPSTDPGFLEQSEFKDFYKFCFQFNRQGSQHRTLDKDLTVQLWKLVLQNERVSNHRLQSFCDFVQENSSYSRITLDQWTSFLDFCHEMPDGLGSYDESVSAWPVLIDEYVEYMQKKS